MLKLYVADTGLITNQAVFEELLKQVKTQRRVKALRCKNEKDKYCSLLAGLLLRHALEEEGMDYDTLEFGVTPEHKPVLVSNPNLHFSISHSGNRAVCLISDKQIGVDIESKSRRLLDADKKERLQSMAKRAFHETEYEAFVSAPMEQRQELFLKFWTRKEAVSKAVGKGLAMDFSQIHEAEDKYRSFWLDEEYYLSIYMEEEIKEEVVICTMN